MCLSLPTVISLIRLPLPGQESSTQVVVMILFYISQISPSLSDARTHKPGLGLTLQRLQNLFGEWLGRSRILPGE